MTPQGRAAARLSGERLASEGIQVVISSPLRRAARTADEVLNVVRAQLPALAVKFDDRLREIELCNWEGLHLEEISRRFPEQYHDWRLRPEAFYMRLAENEIQSPVRNLYHRVRSFWHDLLSTHRGRSVLLVSHGGTIRALITSALDLGPEHFHRFQQSNCGLSCVRFGDSLTRARLGILNDTTHLGERLPKLKEGRKGVRLLLIPVGNPNPEAVRRLASGLAGIAIDHMFVVDAAARSVANQILNCHPDSCWAPSEVTHSDAVVEQALRGASPDQLCHVVILGPQLALRWLLQRHLGISAGAAESFDLRQLEITSVHCPGNGTPPVLQAMNMFKPVASLVEVRA